MADTNEVHIGENTPEFVAYRLMKDIALAEGRGPSSNASNPATREYLLQSYAQCLRVVRQGWDGPSAIKELPITG